MGLQYDLVNQTKREIIHFGGQIPAGKPLELVAYPPAGSMVIGYLLRHPGDEIAFVDDHGETWPFVQGSWPDHLSYRDVTNEVIEALIEQGTLRDEGREFFDDGDPEVYARKLRVDGWRWDPDPEDRRNE